MNDEVLSGLIELLRAYVQPLRTLPEPLITECVQLSSRPNLDAAMLAHKVTVFVV